MPKTQIDWMNEWMNKMFLQVLFIVCLLSLIMNDDDDDVCGVCVLFINFQKFFLQFFGENESEKEWEREREREKTYKMKEKIDKFWTGVFFVCSEWKTKQRLKMMFFWKKERNKDSIDIR